MTSAAVGEFPLQYVVLRHEGVDHPHFDLLFEIAPGSLLAAWRSESWPPGKGELVPLPPHRRRYLTYEGPIEGNRGHVKRIAEGNHQLRAEGDRVILRTSDDIVINEHSAGVL